MLKLTNKDTVVDKLEKINNYSIQIIKSYLFKFYNKERSLYFNDKYEYTRIDEDDSNFFPTEYVLTYEKDENKVNFESIEYGKNFGKIFNIL